MNIYIPRRMHICRRASSCAQDAGCSSASPSRRAMNRDERMHHGGCAHLCGMQIMSAKEICVNYYILTMFKGHLLSSDHVHRRTSVYLRILFHIDACSSYRLVLTRPQQCLHIHPWTLCFCSLVWETPIGELESFPSNLNDLSL